MANQYLKPQIPLKDLNSENYFYPLTTSDQIIIGDSRLSAFFDKTTDKLSIVGNIDATIKLTGDTVGTSSSILGTWTIPTTTSKLSGLGRRRTADAIQLNPSVDTGFKISWHISDSTSRTNDAANSPSFDCTIINLPWDWGGYNGQIALRNTASPPRMQIRAAGNVDNGEGANPRYSPSYGDWREVVTAPKATQVGNATTPVYINNQGQVTITSLSTEYVTLNTAQTITGVKTFTNTITGDILSTWHVLAGRPSNTTNFRTYFETINNLHHDNPARTDSEMSYNRFFASNSDQTTYGPSALNLPVVDQHVLSFGIDNNVVYSRHIALDIRTNKMFLGGRINNTWQGWSEIIVHDLAQTITGVKTFSNANPIIQNNAGRATLEIKTIGNDANDLWMSTNNAHRWSLSARPSGENYSIGLWAANATAGWAQMWYQDKHSHFYGYVELQGANNIRRTASGVSWIKGRDSALVRLTSFSGYTAIWSAKTTNGDWCCGPYNDNILYWSYGTDANYNSNTNSVVQMRLTPAGYLYSARIYTAVWNDYAEYRESEETKPGTCVQENDNGKLTLTNERLIPGASIVSDTYGYAQGETEKAKTPIATSGRVLAYTYQNRKNYHAGMSICSAPNGTVDIMTREEIQQYPDAIIGIVSEIPDYEFWGDNKQIPVNNRIWIKVRY